jgi:hypothetical protein
MHWMRQPSPTEIAFYAEANPQRGSHAESWRRLTNA